MKSVELYAQVRYAVQIEGVSRREAARRYGIDPRTVAKMLAFSVPPGYRRSRPPARPKLDPFTGIIDAILAADEARPKKQRHTAKRIFERLRDEHGYAGGITIVKDYVLSRRLRHREVFVPLRHDPGHAQVDFGEALAEIAGVERKIHFFAMDLPHSDACFVRAYPAETAEAFCDGHNAAFSFFGKVPGSILYDNTTLAVARILGDGVRQRTRVFSELQSHYLFADRFGRPGKGNDKGKVEGLVGWARRNLLVPVPRAASFAALNEQLLEGCRRRFGDRLRGHEETIGERLVRDLAAFHALPPAPYDACEKKPGRVSSLSLVRYRGTDYSVPTAYGHREVLIRGYVNEVVICCGAEVIARHPRSYEREDFVFNPLHYLALLEQKIGALDQAAPLVGWDLPEEFATLRRLIEARMAKRGKREFVQILRLLEVFRPEDVLAAIKEAIARGAIGFDAVKHLVLCRIEHRPPRLDLTVYPYLPRARVATTSAKAYLALLSRRRGHERHAAAPARPSPQGAQAADVLARIRQACPAVRRRGCRSPPLFAAPGRTRTDRAGTPDMIERRIKEARFPTVKSLDSFDFTAIPSLNKALVLELARCEYIARRENVIAVGNSGTGKSHIALGLGLAACQKGLSVGFTTAAAMVHELIEARDEKRLLRLQRQLSAYKLLIIDELGYVPLSTTGAELLFEVFSQRYERGSTLVTSNLPFDEWTGVFGSERLTGALLDRLTHHVHILEMNGDSYRLKQSKQRQHRT